MIKHFILLKNIPGSGIKNENVSHLKLAEKLHKPIINFKKGKVYSFFIEKILGCWFCWYAIDK